MCNFRRAIQTSLLLILVPISTFAFAIDIGEYAFDKRSESADGLPNEAVDLNEASRRGSTSLDELPQGEMESLLHWAISHSDPELLKEQAQEATKDQAIASLKERKQRVKELIDIMSLQPTEQELVKEAVVLLVASNSTEDDQLRALEALQVLVEPIDMANDLKVLGGLDPVVKALSSQHASVQAAACYVIGTAASNNPKFQQQLFDAHPDIFKLLLQLLRSSHQEAVVKSVYAVASLVRNQESMRLAFTAAGGIHAVQAVLTSASSEGQSRRAQRKALSLLVDLVTLDSSMASMYVERGVPMTITSLLRTDDSDLQEKSIEAVSTLSRASEHARQALIAAGAGDALDALQALLAQQFQQAMQEDSAADLEDHYHKYLMSMCLQAKQELLEGQHSHTGQKRDEL